MVTTVEEHELVVIGGGPGGYAAALYGASAGLDVALVEKDRLGGTCLNVGCIPAKELLETARVFRTVCEAPQFGVDVGAPTIALARTQERKQAVVDRLVGGLEGLLKNRKIQVHKGVGSLGPGRSVTVSGESGVVELTGEAVCLAPGSTTRMLPGFDVDGEVVVTSDEFLSLSHRPERAVVIGGGAIGCEFGSYLADLGTEVTILEALPELLIGCDDDVAREVRRSFKKSGIEVRTGVLVKGYVGGPTGRTVEVEGAEPIPTDLIVVAVGRRPATEGLGLEGTAVRLDERGFIRVDDRCRTDEPGVYAVGDAIDTPQLAHVGFAEGILAVRAILGEDPAPIDYTRVPWGIYCRPEVAFAGLTEAAARDGGFDVVTTKHRFLGNGRALILGETDGLVKVVAERRADGTAGRILGVHLVGPWVTEQLGAGYLAVNWEATVEDVATLIQPHPTLSEVFGEAVLGLTGRSLHG